MNHQRFDFKSKYSHQKLISHSFLILGIFWLIIFIFNLDMERNVLWKADTTNYNQNWYYLDGNQSVNVKLPIHSKNKLVPANPKDDGWVKIYKKIDFTDEHQSAMFFTTCHKVVVSIIEPSGDSEQEKLIYSYTCENYPKWFKYVGPMCHIFDFPHDMQEGSTICISSTSTHKSKQGQFSEVRIGSRASLIKYLLYRRPLVSISSVIILALAIILLASSVFFKSALKKDHSLRALGYFSLLIGCWFLEDSYLAQLMFSSPMVHWLFKYLFYITVPITLFYFLDELAEVKDNKLIGILLVINLTIIFISICGEFFGICIGKFNFLNDIFLFAMCIIIPYFLKHQSHNGSMLKYFPSIIILEAGFALDIIYYYVNNTEIIGFSALGFLGFFVTLGVIVYSSAVNKIHDFAEIDTLQKLAYVDYSTNVKNRTALYNFVEKFNGPQEEYCLIIFDLNDLKKINDTYGHLYGDKVIKSFSQCAIKSFSSGDIYRVGGDEFVALIKDTTDAKVHEMVEKFEKLVQKQTDVQYKYNVAYGYQFFTPKDGKDFYAAQKAADQKMYSRKSKMKEAGKFNAQQVITDN